MCTNKMKGYMCRKRNTEVDYSNVTLFDFFYILLIVFGRYQHCLCLIISYNEFLLESGRHRYNLCLVYLVTSCPPCY